MHSVSKKSFLLHSVIAAFSALVLCTACGTFDLGHFSSFSDNVFSSDSDDPAESVTDNFAASGEVKDYGMTSKSHTKNVGKIVFSKKFIEFKNENEGAFTGKFIYKGFEPDDIFFMAYFPRSFHNQAVKDGVKPSSGKSKIIFTFTINGKKIEKTAEMNFNGKKFKEWTGFSAGPVNIIGNEPYQKLFTEEVRPLMTEYENRVKLEITFKTEISGGKMWSPGKPMATGEFVVVIDKNMKGRLMPKPEMKISKYLESRIKKCLTNDYGEILRVVVVESDWSIVRNELTGVPVKRTIRVAAAIHLNSGEYKVYFYYVSQQYDGSKYTDAVFYESVATDEYDIDKNDIYK